MNPYHDLTYRGRLRRMRQLAQLALQKYGLQDAPFKLVVQAGNTLFRVYGPASPFTAGSDDLFEPGQYLLRVHEPGYQEPEAIDLELTWLAAMRREANLPVPEPIPTLDGQWVLSVAKDINLLAFKLLRPGGLLFTFSCSGGVDSLLFQKIVASAALDAGVDAQIIHHLSQAPDHPVALSFPESAYLKGLVCRKS